MPEPIRASNLAVQIRTPNGDWEPLKTARVELTYTLDEPIPAQPRWGDVSMSFTVDTRGWKQASAKAKRALRRYASFDMAAPHDDVSAGMLIAASPDGSFRVLETWPRPIRKHACSAMASRLRAHFPRLTTAQIERLARVIRRKQGRSQKHICSVMGAKPIHCVRGAK